MIFTDSYVEVYTHVAVLLEPVANGAAGVTRERLIACGKLLQRVGLVVERAPGATDALEMCLRAYLTMPYLCSPMLGLAPVVYPLHAVSADQLLAPQKLVS